MGKTEVNVKEYKKEAVTKIQGILKDKNEILFTDFLGLSVEQITELRNKIAEQNSCFTVIKNNYAKIALKNMEQPDVGSFLFGPTAICAVESDIGPIAKTIVVFGKGSTVKVKGGIINGKIYDQEAITALSMLPGKEQLISMLMSTMNAPVQNFVYVINGVTQKLVRTLQAVADKKAAEG